MHEERAQEAELRVINDELDRTWEVRAIRPTDDRRSRLLPADHANGWLLFSLGLERRRFAPVPPNWHNAPHEELKRWWANAAPVVPRTRRSPPEQS